MDDATVPRRLAATCVECSGSPEETGPFTLSDASVPGLAAEYECSKCGHAIVLELDP